MSKSKVLLVGSGGVGTIGAFSLEYAGKSEVTAVVRSDYDIVKEKGYEIDSCDYGIIKSFKPTNLVNSIEAAKEFGPFEYIVITTKNLPDVFKIEELIQPVVTKDSAIILIQNGIEIGAPILEAYPENIVLSGVQMIGSSNRNGKILHTIKDSVKVGYFENKNLPLDVQKAACEKFVELYKTEKNHCEYDEDVKFTRWRKLVYNATFNPICALTDTDSGRMELFGGVDTVIRDGMKEVLKVAKSDGVDLPEDIMEFMIRSDDGVYYAPSMQVDYQKGNYMELEVICGNALRIAQKNKIDTPVLSIIYNLLRVLQMKTKEAKGAIHVPKERPIPSPSMV
jgi:2-dehydropantoate 2-reductase